MRKQVEKVIDEIRPALQADGGDIEVLDVDAKTGVVIVSLQGACNGCPMATITLQDVIARMLKQKVKGFKKIESI